VTRLSVRARERNVFFRGTGLAKAFLKKGDAPPRFWPSISPTLIAARWLSVSRADAVLPEFGGCCVEWSSVRVALR
jgi:hypothetical protein